MVDHATGFATALVAALDRLATGLATRLGLETTPDPERNLPRIEGRIDGVDVRIRQVEHGDGVHIHAMLPVLPQASLTIRACPPSNASGITLHDPILDGTIEVTTDDPEEARTLLVDDQVREDLLAVVKGRDGSHVADGAVFVPVSTVEPDAVVAAVADAVALARSLSTERRDADDALRTVAARAPKQST